MSRSPGAAGQPPPVPLWQAPALAAVPGAYYRWLPVHYLTPDLPLLQLDAGGAVSLRPSQDARQRFQRGEDNPGIEAVAAFVRWRPALVLATTEVLPPALLRRERSGDYWGLPLYSLRGAGFEAREVAALQARQWANARFLRGDAHYRIEDGYVDFRRAQVLVSSHLAAATQVARLNPDAFAALCAAFRRFLAALE